MENALTTFRKERDLPKDSKVFVVIGHYDDLRQEMLARGWAEHEH